MSIFDRFRKKQPAGTIRIHIHTTDGQTLEWEVPGETDPQWCRSMAYHLGQLTRDEARMLILATGDDRDRPHIKRLMRKAGLAQQVVH